MLGTQESVSRLTDVKVREGGEFRFIKASEVVPVEPKAFRVLLFLLQSPQKLCILTNLFMPGLVKR
jgi:DNA-binding winged helix-turn-helix (wHTH) protein